MSSRRIGQYFERKAETLAKSWGYDALRLYQPRGQRQLCDLILIGHGRIRFVEVRKGAYRMGRSEELLRFNALHCGKAMVPTCEVWRFDGRGREPRQRVME